MIESEFVTHVPCDNCGSSDANSLYSDGHEYCFSCQHFKPSVSGGLPLEDDSMSSSEFVEGEYRPLSKRKITEETCRHYGYQIGRFGGGPCHIAPLRDASGKLIAQKIRTPDKTFPTLGAKGKALPLFGMHKWHGGKMVVVTEGEIDCLSVSQVQQNKWPVVSLPNGASAAKKAFLNNLDWLESFETVVLMFDMDDPGRAAVEECAPILSPGKVKVATLPLKDANEMLQAGRGAEIIQAIWNAKPYRPDGVLTGEDLKPLLSKKIEHGVSYPWESLTRLTYGARPHEIYTLLAGSGMGKTEVFKEIAYHFAHVRGKTVGIFFLEEPPEHTVRCLLSKHLQKRIYIPGVEVDQGEIEDSFSEIFGGNRVHIFKHDGCSDFDIIKSRIRYMVLSGCEYIFLDHITAMAEGKGDDSVNSKIHYMMEELNKLTQNLPFSIFLISHLRKTNGNKPAEEGGRVTLDDAYGSGAIKQRSNYVFALERNQQAEGEDRHVSTFRILKDRLTGAATGETFKLKYDQETGRLNEYIPVDDTFEEELDETTNSEEF